MKIIIREVETSEEMEAAQAIRFEVFVKEQNVPPLLEKDPDDEKAMHVIALKEGLIIGTGRLLILGNIAKIGRIAVIHSERHRGVGTAIVKKLIEIAVQRGIREIFLHAQIPIVPFYALLGFVPQGPVFQEAGIPHRRMKMKFQNNDDEPIIA